MDLILLGYNICQAALLLIRRVMLLTTINCYIRNLFMNIIILWEEICDLGHYNFAKCLDGARVCEIGMVVMYWS